jgi:hypothetical protein
MITHLLQAPGVSLLHLGLVFENMDFTHSVFFVLLYSSDPGEDPSL